MKADAVTVFYNQTDTVTGEVQKNVVGAPHGIETTEGRELGPGVRGPCTKMETCGVVEQTKNITFFLR